jgi:hypothetical protein
MTPRVACSCYENEKLCDTGDKPEMTRGGSTKGEKGVTYRRLFAVALALIPAEVFCRTAEAKLTATDIERTFRVRHLGILTTLCLCIAVAPALVIWGDAVSAT